MCDLFNGKAYDIEHALLMFASGFVTLPAATIYDDERIAPLCDQIRKSHIYFIGITPEVHFVGASQNGRDLITAFIIANRPYDLRWPLPLGWHVGGGPERGWYIAGPEGKRSFPSEVQMMKQLKDKCHAIDFKVLYIGQAYGEDGARNALDRLRKHETLQKIALEGTPSGYKLTILMFEVEPVNKLITLMNPYAEDRMHGAERIDNGLSKLFETSDAERIALYEAAMIRYFQPPYNKHFKNSFPSTNIKILADCYRKDFNAIFAEISIDELPFALFSDSVKADISHMVVYELHTDQERRGFFGELGAG